MSDNLLIGILGRANAGKSNIFYKLFGRKVYRTKRPRRLVIGPGEYVEVYIITSSSEELDKDIKDLIIGEPRIIICALGLGYRKRNVKITIDYFAKLGYYLSVYWLNPGWRDTAEYPDRFGIESHIGSHPSTIVKRAAQPDASDKATEILNYIREWAAARGLIRSN